jgi:hypothetical protein
MADESTRGGANADFPRFKAGQSAADVLSASYQNKLISQIERECSCYRPLHFQEAEEGGS